MAFFFFIFLLFSVPATTVEAEKRKASDQEDTDDKNIEDGHSLDQVHEKGHSRASHMLQAKQNEESHDGHSLNQGHGKGDSRASHSHEAKEKEESHSSHTDRDLGKGHEAEGDENEQKVDKEEAEIAALKKELAALKDSSEENESNEEKPEESDVSMKHEDDGKDESPQKHEAPDHVRKKSRLFSKRGTSEAKEEETFNEKKKKTKKSRSSSKRRSDEEKEEEKEEEDEEDDEKDETKPNGALKIGSGFQNLGAECSSQLLTTLITNKHFTMRNSGPARWWGYMKEWYESVENISHITKGKVKATVLHTLPDYFVKKYETKAIKFVRVDPMNFSQKLSVGEVRFFLYQEALRAHPDWTNVFLTDIKDVTINWNPCKIVELGTTKGFKLFTAKDYSDLGGRKLRFSFEAMGGKYKEWYEKQFVTRGPLTLLYDLRTVVKPLLEPIGIDKSILKQKQMFNPGVLGGSNEQVQKFLERYVQVIDEVKVGRTENRHDMTMPAFNYILFQEYDAREIFTKSPFVSKIHHWKDDGHDAFTHK